jgi:hypothetical protein
MRGHKNTGPRRNESSERGLESRLAHLLFF